MCLDGLRKEAMSIFPGCWCFPVFQFFQLLLFRDSEAFLVFEAFNIVMPLDVFSLLICFYFLRFLIMIIFKQSYKLLCTDFPFLPLTNDAKFSNSFASKWSLGSFVPCWCFFYLFQSFFISIFLMFFDFFQYFLIFFHLFGLFWIF